MLWQSNRIFLSHLPRGRESRLHSTSNQTVDCQIGGKKGR